MGSKDFLKVRISFLLGLILLMLFIVSCSAKNKGEQRDYVSISEINLKNIEDSLELAGQWMVNSQNNDGSLKYKYLPDKDEYPDQNNMIRQFMGTIALAEMYGFNRDENYKQSFEKNLKYNLNNYYQEEGDIGYIYYNNMSKLGSAAFALISVLDFDGNEYALQKKKIENFIFFMHNSTNGRFRTFYLPAGIDRNQNFYPGEAMLALMIDYEQTKDEKYLSVAESSFDYYADFFRKEKNPAFVPWHTMANYKLFKATGDKKYADFVFEMNDFLVGIQNKECGKEPYTLGRFFDPERSEYGPPHASSTAVYVEGLTYAYKLAKELGDNERAAKYKGAVLLGARSLMQLQFKEGNKKVLGGIRKTIDNNELRIDNTQHTVMAFIQILNSFDDKEISDFVVNNKQFLCRI